MFSSFFSVNPSLDGVRLQSCKAIPAEDGLDVVADLVLIVQIGVIGKIPLDVVLHPIVQIVGHANLGGTEYPASGVIFCLGRGACCQMPLESVIIPSLTLKEKYSGRIP